MSTETPTLGLENILSSHITKLTELADALVVNRERLAVEASSALFNISEKDINKAPENEIEPLIRQYISCSRDAHIMQMETEKVLYALANLVKLVKLADIDLNLPEGEEKRFDFFSDNNPEFFFFYIGE